MRALISRYPATLEIETPLTTEVVEFVELRPAGSGIHRNPLDGRAPTRSTVGTIMGEVAVRDWLAARAGDADEAGAIYAKARAWFCAHRVGGNAATRGQDAILRLLPPGSYDEAEGGAPP